MQVPELGAFSHPGRHSFSEDSKNHNINSNLLEEIKQHRIAGKPVDLNIIQVYAPTANSNDEDLDKFYNDLDTARTQCKSQDPLIIMGDFNAKVGTEKVDDILGKHGLGIRNERGPPIMKEEVETAMKKMKHGKATGPDNISVELIEPLKISELEKSHIF
ncbi:craniofacial development protein 2 [Plakobranchus ocellatus]|uniref:Craniofacial development protein 2 n=1 Tax=Plakobranchus ocellatus TaxID=259542 RepID=A0AAV3YMJ1_9GAST|nr:craniofacial development protein 2 [Plakobranchus ocellatus]